MKQKDEIKKKLLDIRGKVIHDYIEIELFLGVEITDYFFTKNSPQNRFLLAYP